MPSKKVKKKKPIKTWRIVIEKFCNVIETHVYEGVKATTEAEAIAMVEKWDETGEVKPDDVDENMEFDFQNVYAYLMKSKKGIYEWLFKGRKT
tara:strand:- start:136 stop:414 length:279 start_codon:yes stop_codon:yes gene_type:complete